MNIATFAASLSRAENWNCMQAWKPVLHLYFW